MVVRETPGPETRARRLAKRGAEYAAAGRRRDSEIAFKKAFEAVRGMSGSLGTERNGVFERSALAAELADHVLGAGLSAEFALRMWGLGCNAGVLSRHDMGATDIVYPLEVMEIAARERSAEEKGVPPVVCEVEEKKVRKEKKARTRGELFDEMVSAARRLPFVGSLFGEEGERSEAGKDKRR